jgi:hypothetical protein
VAWLKEELTRGEDPRRVLGHCADLHVLASLLTKFLRELPEPVVPPGSVEALRALGAAPAPLAMAAFVGGLPPINQEFIYALVAFLQAFQRDDAGVRKLALIFAPSLIRHGDPMEMRRWYKADAEWTAQLIRALPVSAAVRPAQLTKTPRPTDDVAPPRPVWTAPPPGAEVRPPPPPVDDGGPDGAHALEGADAGRRARGGAPAHARAELERACQQPAAASSSTAGRPAGADEQPTGAGGGCGGLFQSRRRHHRPGGWRRPVAQAAAAGAGAGAAAAAASRVPRGGAGCGGRHSRGGAGTA